LMNVLQETHWYPNTAVYASSGSRFPWFLKAKTSRSPDRLAVVTGLNDWKTVRDTFVDRFASLTRNGRYEVFNRGRQNYAEVMSLE